MAILIGTSGYNYPEWRGTFYPEKFPTGKMLPYYAERFGTVEVNYTFYRMPSAKTVAGWDRDTPAGFRFALKAPQRITHFARLRDRAYGPDELDAWARTAARIEWRDAFVYFKHEESGTGPALARELVALLPGAASLERPL